MLNHKARSQGASALVRAAETNNFSLASQIVTRGDYDADEYRAAIMKSAGFGFLDLTKALASLKENSNSINVSAARLASQYGHETTLFFFLNEMDVDPNANSGALAEIAAQYNRVNSLKILDSFGFDFELNGGRAFQNAAKYVHVESINFLLKRGAPIDSSFHSNDRTGGDRFNSSSDPYDAIYRLASKGDAVLDTFKILVEDCKISYEVSSTAMVRAASYGQIKLMTYLLHNGADINFDKVAALSESVRFNQKVTVNYILRNTSYSKHLGLQRALKKANDFKRTSNRAPENESDSMSRLIIREILNEDSGQTLQSMMVRCLNGKQWFAAEDIISMHPNILDVSDIVARIVKFASGSLLEHAISYGVKLTPDLLDMAIEYNNQECAKILYDEGLRPTDLDASFINACKHGYSEMVEELIELGADITCNNSAGINLACQNNHDDVVKKLKKLGEAPNEMSLELAEDNRNYVAQKYYERRA